LPPAGPVSPRSPAEPGHQGRFIFGAGLAVSLVTSLAEAEGVGLALPGGRRLDFWSSGSPNAGKTLCLGSVYNENRTDTEWSSGSGQNPPSTQRRGAAVGGSWRSSGQAPSPEL